LSQAVEAFLTFLHEDRRLSLNTLSAYRNDLRQFEAYFCTARAEAFADAGNLSAARSVIAANRDQVVDFFLYLREKGYSPATIARKMAAVRSFFLSLERSGQIRSSPAALLGSPEVKKPLPRAISVDEVDLLIQQAGRRPGAEGLRDAAMLRLLCATGMRVTELVSLNLEDASLATATISCSGRNGRRRELPIEGEVVRGLQTYLNHGRPGLARGELSAEAMFLNHRGRRLTRQGFWLIMKALARSSGLAAEVTPHTLRHSFAAHRLRDGLELDRLRELLGHANISTTQIYTQLSVGEAPPEAVTPVRNVVGAGS
jgi:integrase/recombinase XerD